MTTLVGAVQDYEPTAHSCFAECVVSSYSTVLNDYLSGLVSSVLVKPDNVLLLVYHHTKTLLRRDLVRFCAVVMQILYEHNIVILV